MARVDPTQPKFPGDAIRNDTFYYLDVSVHGDIPTNGILKKWNRHDDIVSTTYDMLELEAKRIMEGWCAAKAELPHEAYTDVPSAIFTSNTLSLKLVKEALGPQLSDENGKDPVYFRGSFGSHLYSVGTYYEAFANQAEPFATAMEMTWNALRMFKAEKEVQKTVANEMNYRLYIYACSLAEGRRGHRLHPRRHGLFVEKWFENEVRESQERDRYFGIDKASLKRRHDSTNGMDDVDH